MIKLHTFGPAFGLPDGSPFVVKAHLLLRMAGVAYEAVRSDPRKAPKGKLPYIDDDGTIVADSGFIRRHIEATRGFDFDKGLSAAEKGCAYAVEKMLEEHVYWLAMHDRWVDETNFNKGPRSYFEAVPGIARPFVIRMVRKEISRALHGQGIGRLSDAERATLAVSAVEALSDVLGDRPWLGGEKPCGADATGVAFVSTLLCPLFQCTLLDEVRKRSNLVAYAERGMALWMPDFA